ncbi:MAG: LapA family protein [Lachnospiraceae bacterium]|nr:LapA family protein [Lachnospiraceae bacterium]
MRDYQERSRSTSNRGSRSVGTYQSMTLSDRNSSYQYGSAVPKQRPRHTDDDRLRREMERKPAPVVSERVRRNREKAKSMNLGVVLLFSAVFVVLGVAVFGELSLQASNARLRREIASMKSELNNVRLDNEEEYSRIMGSVDMQAIKDKAIGQLGMQYAQSGQVVVVADATDDYVHQYQDIQ